MMPFIEVQRAHPDLDSEMIDHVDGCPLARPWLYDPDEHPLECTCQDLLADEDTEE